MIISQTSVCLYFWFCDVHRPVTVFAEPRTDKIRGIEQKQVIIYISISNILTSKTLSDICTCSFYWITRTDINRISHWTNKKIWHENRESSCDLVEKNTVQSARENGDQKLKCTTWFSVLYLYSKYTRVSELSKNEIVFT